MKLYDAVSGIILWGFLMFLLAVGDVVVTEKEKVTEKKHQEAIIGLCENIDKKIIGEKGLKCPPKKYR